jgi:hypothetical protein
MQLLTPPIPARRERPWVSIINHSLTILPTLGALGSSLLVPRFRLIFQDLLGEQPLPLLTSVVLTFHPLLVFLACTAVAAAIYSAWHYGRTSAPLLITLALTTFSGAQMLVTVVALFLPLIPIIQSFSSAK